MMREGMSGVVLGQAPGHAVDIASAREKNQKTAFPALPMLIGVFLPASDVPGIPVLH